MVRKIGIFILNTILLAGCSFGDKNDKEVFTGKVEGNKVNASSEISGKIIEINIEEGKSIKAGDKIAVIDTRDLSLRLKKAERALELSEAKLQDAINGARNEEIKAQQSNLKSIEAQIEGSRKNYNHRLKNYEKTLNLYENSAVSEQQLDDAKALLDNEATNINSLEKQYDGVKAQLDLLIAGATDQKIKMIESEVEIARSEVDIINNQIEKGKVISSIDGTIQNMNYSVGELITTGGSIATIIEDNNLWVKIYIPEKQLHKISINDELNLRLDFMKDEKIVGKVIYISSEAEFTPKNVESKESKTETVFEVKVKIVDSIDRLKPGMLVDVVLKGDM